LNDAITDDLLLHESLQITYSFTFWMFSVFHMSGIATVSLHIF